MMLRRKVLAIGMARQEGWFDPFHLAAPSLPHYNLNPGNLRWAPARFLQEPKLSRGYVKFVSKEWGWAALDSDLRAKQLRGLSLRAAVHIYCPLGDGANDPDSYTRHVSGWLQVDPAQTLSTLFLDTGRVPGPWPAAEAYAPGAPMPDFAALLRDNAVMIPVAAARPAVATGRLLAPPAAR